MIMGFFHIESNKYSSTFTLNIASSRIYSMNKFIRLQANICRYPILSAFQIKGNFFIDIS